MVTSPGCCSISEIIRFDGVAARLARGEFAAGRGHHRRRVHRERADVARACPSGVPTSLAMAAVWISGPSAPSARRGSWRALQQIEDMEHVLGALQRPRHCRARCVMAWTVDLRRAAQEHDQSRAIVAEEAGIGIEEDGILAGAAKRSPAQGIPPAIAVMNSHYSAMRTRAPVTLQCEWS